MGCRIVLVLFLLGFEVFAQAQTPSAVPVPVPVIGTTTPTTTNVTWQPKIVITGGGGFSSPNGKFAYVSESSLLGAGTYSTVAIEDQIVKGQVQSCTLAGITKPMYQFSFLTVGLTGLGGGCTSTNGTAAASGSGQGFLDARFGKTPFGLTFTATKNTAGGWKATLAFRWAQ